jgi:hypothetical protein
MLDILVAQIRLQRAGIVALVGQGEAAGVPEHVRMRLEFEFGGMTGALDHAGETGRGERGAALASEDEGRLRFLFTL